MGLIVVRLLVFSYIFTLVQLYMWEYHAGMRKNTSKKYYSKTEARYNLPSLIDRVKDGGEAVYITEKGAAKVVLLSAAEYNKLTKKKRIKFSETGLAGMWKDRKDMEDSAEWVRKSREWESNRSKRLYEELENEK